MKNTRRFTAVIKVVLGVAGVILCIAVILGVFRVGATVIHLSEEALARVDRTLTSVQDVVGNVKERVHAAKITSQEIEDRLQQWAKDTVSDDVATRLDIDGKAQRLAAGLTEADQWLEFSESSVALIQQALELAGPEDAETETGRVDMLLSEITALRGQLAEAVESVESVRASLQGDGASPDSLRGRIDQAARIVVRMLATLGPLESRLESLQQQLSEVRATALQTNTRMVRWVRMVEIGVVLLALWMAAGQCALCTSGWRTHSASTPAS